MARSISLLNLQCSKQRIDSQKVWLKPMDVHSIGPIALMSPSQPALEKRQRQRLRPISQRWRGSLWVIHQRLPVQGQLIWMRSVASRTSLSVVVKCFLSVWSSADPRHGCHSGSSRKSWGFLVWIEVWTKKIFPSPGCRWCAPHSLAS